MIQTRTAAVGRAIRLVRHAAATGNARPILGTLHFEGDADGFRVVATDGFRLAIATISATGHEDFGEVNLPIASTKLLAPLLAGPDADLTLAVDRERLRVETPPYALTLPIVAGEYPDYREALGRAATAHRLGVNPAYLAEAMRAADQTGIVTVTFGDVTQPVDIRSYDGAYREIIMPVRLGKDHD